MSEAVKGDELTKIAAEYFRRGDAGQPDVVDLFTEDVEIFFPKFGVRRGKSAFFELATGLLSSLKSIAHYQDKLTYAVVGNKVLVEGTTHGETRSGARWEGGKTPGGRFCSVFEFNGRFISRMYIYLDPDYGSADRDRFLWPETATRQW
jgi:hypothetical protein